MDSPCLMFGALVAVLVSLLKRVPFIAANPKAVAFAFVIIAHAIQHFLTGTTPGAETAQQLALCIGEAFAASVATFETVLKPVRNAVNNRGDYHGEI